MPQKKPNQTTFRANVIMYVYQRELINEVRDPFEVGEFTKDELNAIDWINKKYELLKKIVEAHLNENWPWDRLLPLEKAILIFGAFELNIHDKRVVINELVNYAKGYIVEDKYKFINYVLDKIGEDYESKKRNLKKSQTSNKAE